MVRRIGLKFLPEGGIRVKFNDSNAEIFTSHDIGAIAAFAVDDVVLGEGQIQPR